MKTDKAELLQLIKDRYESAKAGPNSCFNEQNDLSDYLNAGSGKNEPHGVKKQSDLKLDLTLVAIEGQSAILNDTPVDILVTPRTPSYDLDALIYQQIVNWVLEENDAEIVRDQLQKFALIRKAGVIKLRIVEEQGRKSIKLTAVDPRFVHIDPVASCPDDISYIIEVTRWTREELKRRYPKASIGSEDVVQDDEAMLILNDGEEGGVDESKDKSLVHVYEMWDMSCDRKEYPNGKYALATEWEVLEDRGNDYPCGIPYVFFSAYSIPDRIYGRGAFRSLKSIQDEIATLYKRMSNITRLAANPTLLLSSRSGLAADSVTNKDGGVLPLNVDDVRAAMEWIYGPGVSPSMLQYADKLQYYFDTISGWNDVMQGRGQINSNMPSGRSLEELQQSAQTRLRQMLRGLKSCYKQLGKKIIQVAHAAMDTETVIRITGSDAQTVQSILEKTYQETLQTLAQGGAVEEEDFKTGLQIFFAEKGIKADKSGKDYYLHVDPTRLGDPTEFGVKVTAGTDIPKSKLDVAAQASQMLQMGLVDPQTYMEATDFPLKEKVMERMPGWQEFQQWKAMQAQQAEMQAQAAQGAPQGPQGVPPPDESMMQPPEQMPEEQMQPEPLE